MNDQNKPQNNPPSQDTARKSDQSGSDRRPERGAETDRTSPSNQHKSNRVTPDQGAKAPTTDQHGKRLDDPAAARKPAGAHDADTSTRDHGRRDDRK